MTTASAGGPLRVSAEHPADPTVFLGIDLGSELHGVPGYRCGKLGYGDCHIDAVFLGVEGELMYDRCMLKVYQVQFSVGFDGRAARQDMEAYRERVLEWLKSDGWVFHPRQDVYVHMDGIYVKSDSVGAKAPPRAVRVFPEIGGGYRLELSVEDTASKCTEYTQ